MMHMSQLRPSRWTIGLAALFFCLTLGIWISATVAIPGYSLPWTPTALLACGLHLTSLAVFSVLPKQASYCIIAIFFIDCVFTSDYAAIQCYGVLLALGYIAYSEPWRHSSVTLLCPITACAISTYIHHEMLAQLFTSITCICLAYTAGFSMRLIAQKHYRQRNQTLRKMQQEREALASTLHSAVTNELTSIILLCEQQSQNGAMHTDTTIIEQQARLALSNAQQTICALHGATVEQTLHTADTVQEYTVFQDALLAAAGFHGSSTCVTHTAYILDRNLIDKALIILKEIYANIARHCPQDGTYSVHVNCYESRIDIQETNPYAENAARRFTSGHGLRNIRQITRRTAGLYSATIDNHQWVIRIQLNA